MFCSVVKHAGSSKSAKEVYGKTRDIAECFSLLLRALFPNFIIILFRRKIEIAQGKINISDDCKEKYGGPVVSMANSGLRETNSISG